MRAFRSVVPAVALLGLLLAGCTDAPPPEDPPYVVTSVDPSLFAGPAGSYVPVAGLCARIDLAAAQQLVGPLPATKAGDDVSIPGSFNRIECEFKGERDRRTVYVRAIAQMYGQAATARDSYEQATKEVDTSCWKEYDSRTPISGLGTNAHADRCLDPNGYPPTDLYKLHVVDDNLYLRVTVHALDSTGLPAPTAVAEAGRAAAQSILTALRRP